jgi:hypothetical protein
VYVWRSAFSGVKGKRAVLRFFLLFLAIQTGLFVAELTPPGQALVIPWTATLARLSVILVTLFDPHVIISLFYLGQWRMDVFEFAHLYLWQALIMLDVLVVWLIWIRAMPVQIATPHGA